jgi:hypothetical protein
MNAIIRKVPLTFYFKPSEGRVSLPYTKVRIAPTYLLMTVSARRPIPGMLSPLLGIAGVNSLLFGAFSVAKRIITPFPDLSIQQIALAGSMAGAANAILASPGDCRRL